MPDSKNIPYGGGVTESEPPTFEPAEGEGYCTTVYSLGISVIFKRVVTSLPPRPSVILTIENAIKGKQCVETPLQDCSKAVVNGVVYDTSEFTCKSIKDLLNEPDNPDIGDLISLLTDSLNSIQNYEGSDPKANELKRWLERVCKSLKETGNIESGDIKTLSFDFKCCEITGTCNPNNPKSCNKADFISIEIDPKDVVGFFGGFISNQSLMGSPIDLPESIVRELCCYIGCPNVPISIDDDEDCNVRDGWNHPDCKSIKDNATRALCAVGYSLACWKEKQKECYKRNCGE